jgi:hypothetical protein
MMNSLLLPAFAAARMFTESLLSNDDIPLLLHVWTCLQSCCLAMVWSNPLQYETSSATWNLGTNTAFALGPRKTTESLDLGWNPNFSHVIFKNSVCTSQETHYVSATKPNRLMLFRETVAVYCDSNVKHVNTLCGQNAEFLNVKTGGTYSNHAVLKG